MSYGRKEKKHGGILRQRTFSGDSELQRFWTLSTVRYSKKNGQRNVSETGSFSVFK
jgi:hypothetical protein